MTLITDKVFILPILLQPPQKVSRQARIRLSKNPLFSEVKTGGLAINAKSYGMFSKYPDVLNVEDIQSAMGVGRTTAYRLINNGDIILEPG